MASNRTASGQHEADLRRRRPLEAAETVFDQLAPGGVARPVAERFPAPPTPVRHPTRLPAAVEEPAEKPEAKAEARAEARGARPRLGLAGGFGLAILVPSLAVLLLVLILQLRSLTQALLLAIPVGMLGVGLERISKALRVGLLRTVGALVVVLAVGGPLVLATVPTEPLDRSRSRSPVPGGVSEARLQASMGSGVLRARPGGSGLYEADLRSVGRSTAQVSGTDGLAVVDLDAPQQRGLLARNRGSEWDVALSTALPWQVRFDASAVTADLDVQQLNVTGVEVDAGPSRLVLRLGQPGARTPVTVDLDAGTIDLYLPRTAGVELEITGRVLSDLGDRPLEPAGPAWRAGDTAERAYLIKLHLGAGRVRLHWR